MARVRSRDTGPELAFRRAIWRLGYRFRVCDRRLPGKPDLVFPRHRLVVFIDGDFWHGGQWRRRRLAALDEQFVGAENALYWKAKIRRNIERDFRHTAALLDLGWRVLRFWETDLTKRLDACLATTVNALAVASEARPRPHLPIAERTVAEFFAGIGLVRLAVEQQGWRVVFANDFDPRKAVMYRDQFGDDHLSTADIHSLDADLMPSATLFCTRSLAPIFRWPAPAGARWQRLRRLLGLCENPPRDGCVARRWCCSKTWWASFPRAAATILPLPCERSISWATPPTRSCSMPRRSRRKAGLGCSWSRDKRPPNRQAMYL